MCQSSLWWDFGSPHLPKLWMDYSNTAVGWRIALLEDAFWVRSRMRRERASGLPDCCCWNSEIISQLNKELDNYNEL